MRGGIGGGEFAIEVNQRLAPVFLQGAADIRFRVLDGTAAEQCPGARQREARFPAQVPRDL